ncbi:MAG: PKD domain-containing protein [Bacteroidales bacterium]|jgi:hypothetical protein
MAIIRNIAWLFLGIVSVGSCSSDQDDHVYIGFSIPDKPQYAPCEIRFLNYTKGATTYLWEFGDQITSTEFEPAHLFTVAGVYQITLTATNKKESKSLTREVTILEKVPVVSSPPVSLGLDPFYKKYIDAQGIPVISSDKVPDEALIKVAKMANYMLKKDPEVRAKMISYHGRIGIMSKDEVTTDIPEHAFLANDPTTDWDKRARGLGGTVDVPITTCAEENVLCYTVDPYKAEDIFVHEFAHAIHLMGVMFVDTEFNTKLHQAYNEAKQAGKWVRTYAGTNTEEYWAEGVQCWFNCAAQSDPPNGVYNHVNTRSELQEYDRGLYELVRTWFADEQVSLSCHSK